MPITTEACRTEAIDASLKEYVKAAEQGFRNMLGKDLYNIKEKVINDILVGLSRNSAACAQVSVRKDLEPDIQRMAQEIQRLKRELSKR